MACMACSAVWLYRLYALYTLHILTGVPGGRFTCVQQPLDVANIADREDAGRTHALDRLLDLTLLSVSPKSDYG